MNHTEIRKELRKIREKKQISRERLAELTGISVRCLVYFENGQQDTGLEKVTAIAEALDSSLSIKSERSSIKDKINT